MLRHALPVLILVAFLLGREPLLGTAVEFDSVETTWHAGTSESLRETIDGLDVGLHGWLVAPQTDQPHSAMFRVKQPVNASDMDLTLCFLSGRPNTFFGEFSISVTTDSEPTLTVNGNWEKLVPQRFTSTGPGLTVAEDGRLQAVGKSADAVFQISARTAGDAPITAFRIDVFPSRTSPKWMGVRLASSGDGDFLLTEFRVDAETQRTSNVAWRRPVKSSHPLYFTESNLTDGLPGTFTHPKEAGLGKSFWFELDLGATRSLDHLVLRNRGDGAVPERMTRLLLSLYDRPPEEGAQPVWTGMDRADGSHPPPGEVDVIRESDGIGTFVGRWLRISSDSPIAYTPQLAEVEAYEDIALQLAGARADGNALPGDLPLRIPAGTRWLVFNIKVETPGGGEDRPLRWRLRGFHSDWQTISNSTAEGSCPPAGEYAFEAQVRHTDREWDSRTLSIPVVVNGYIWQNGLFRFFAGTGSVLCMAWIVRVVTRRRLARRMAKLEAEAALDEERARISRDMHDEVGAQLAQLAILQSMFAREHHLPPAAQESMQQLAQSTRRAVASLDEVVWAVNPKNDTLPSLAAYLEQYATSYLEPVEITCRIDAPYEWPEREVHAAVRHNLVLAFREALQNVLKHAGATEVRLHLRFEEPQFIIRLADNGKGIPSDTSGLGKDGLINMSARLESIGGHFEVRPCQCGGTEVEMRVQLLVGKAALTN